MTSSSLILVLLSAIIVSIWIDSTESTTSVYPIIFTMDKPEIALDPFPYDIPCVSVIALTCGNPCVWFINYYDSNEYYHNDTYLLLQPFGVNFTRSRVSCMFLDTGKSYNLLFGSMCPCKISMHRQKVREEREGERDPKRGREGVRRKEGRKGEIEGGREGRREECEK